ncbi:MAG: hypothetical protein B6245_18635 [Desulfobacteraceae bacterium 4572_88]|nr:MAG: hypothetical protein B6245_18635 [Desulfobacteraceae bacterium 4572_88]
MKGKKRVFERIAEIVGRMAEWKIFDRITESIRTKLLFWFIVIAIIPLIALGGMAYMRSSETLEKKTFDNLKAVKSIKSATIETYFKNRRYDMNVLVETVETLRQKALNQLASMQQLKKGLIESYFAERLNDVKTLAALPTVSEALAAFRKNAGIIGGPDWKTSEQIYGSFFERFTENYGYDDIFLVSTEGDILYTVVQESDMGQNLKTGELKDGPAGAAFEKGLSSIAFQDFGEYAPAGDVPSAFISAPVMIGGRITGVVMAQVSIDQINAIMQERTGLGETGGTYLVGADRFFRSDSVHVRESTVMNPAYVVDTVGITEALEGRTGQGVIVDYRGEYVLSSWTPVTIQDITWAMLAEIDVTEAFVPKNEGEEKDFFTKYKEEYGYHDLCLINPDGYLFYSVEQEKDYQTNMLAGPYKDSNLGRLVAKVITQKAFGMADFEKYGPSKNTPAAFLAQPIVRGGQVELVVATKLSLDQINTIMNDRTGLGNTGENYLIGPDKLWRNDSRFVKELNVKTTVLNPKTKVDTAASQGALAGKSGTKVIEDYRKKKVLSSWSPVTVMVPGPVNPKGVRWALIADIEYGEVSKPVRDMIIRGGITVLITLLLVALVASFLSWGLTTQVNHIMALFGEIGIGNFEARAPVTSRDELGSMAISLNAMLDNTLSLIQSSEERDAMQDSIMHLLEEISGLAQGDLTKRANVTEDFTGAIADSFNDMAEQIGAVVRNVKDSRWLRTRASVPGFPMSPQETPKTGQRRCRTPTGPWNPYGSMSRRRPGPSSGWARVPRRSETLSS